MRLRPGVTAAHAIETLLALAQYAEDLRASDASGKEVERLYYQYLIWAERAEPELRDLFVEPDLVATLHSARYWHIRERDCYSLDVPLIGAEFDTQVAVVHATADRLAEFARVAARAGSALMLDTNVFLHCHLFPDIDWRAEFDAAEIRLVVPLLVLDELDGKTFSANSRLSGRANKVLREFDRFMDEIVDDGAAEIQPGVTLEVLLDEDDHQRRTNADTELLDRAEFFHQVIDRPVTVVTTGHGIRARGKARGLQVRPMPDHLRLPPSDDTDNSTWQAS